MPADRAVACKCVWWHSRAVVVVAACTTVLARIGRTLVDVVLASVVTPVRKSRVARATEMWFSFRTLTSMLTWMRGALVCFEFALRA